MTGFKISEESLSKMNVSIIILMPVPDRPEYPVDSQFPHSSGSIRR